jgi:hypothetical protein
MSEQYTAKVKYNGNYFFSDEMVCGVLVRNKDGVFIDVSETDSLGNVVRSGLVEVQDDTLIKINAQPN